jgi:hypothetical protein
MVKTLDEADSGRPYISDMRVNPRNFLSPLLLITGKEQEHGGRDGTPTLHRREFQDRRCSCPLGVLGPASALGSRGAATGSPAWFSNKICPQQDKIKIKSDIYK